MKLKTLVSMIGLFGFCGCSWVTRYYVFSPSESTIGWEYQYIEGQQKSVKQVPTEDKGMTTFENNYLKIQISGDYSIVNAVGPLWFPFIPYFQPTNKNLFLHLLMTAKDNEVNVNFAKFRFYINNETFHRSPKYEIHDFYMNDLRNQNILTIEPWSAEEIFLNFSVDISTVHQIKIQLDGIKINSSPIDIPILYLENKKGRLNYDELTV